MQIKNWKALFLLPLLAAACSQEPASEHPAAKAITVTVGSEPGIGIKPLTALGEDGITVTWTTQDTVALWALNASGAAQFAAKPFALWHYNADFNAAKFTADIDPMPEGAYTYYAVSPRPASVSGLKASFAIPAEQTGLFDGASDVMVATPVQGSALREGDNSDVVNLRFSHKVHVLKIRIPENKMGAPVTSLELTFPQPVTGTLTVDAADPSAAPVLTDGNNILMLNFKNPIDVGSTIFAVIAPVELTSSDLISIKAYTGKKESYPTTMQGKNFREARTTPIALTIPEQHRVTYITFTTTGDGVTPLTIGEQVQHVILKSDDGAVNHSFPVNDQGEYKLTFEGAFDDQFSNKSFSLVFDTENAAVPVQFTMPQINADESNELGDFTVPYLFRETFDSVAGFSNHDNAGGGVTIDTYIDAIDLTDKGLPGWSGTRCGADAGNAFRICARTEDAWVTCPRYHGRVDTAPISGIKPGKSVQVQVSFKYSINISWTSHKPLMAYGYHTTQGLIKSVNSGSTALSNPVAKDLTGSDGDYSTIHGVAPTTYTIPACTNQHRLAWDMYSANRKTGNSNGWCYLDDIQVVITK